jgi:hypothetical protein
MAMLALWSDVTRAEIVDPPAFVKGFTDISRSRYIPTALARPIPAEQHSNTTWLAASPPDDVGRLRRSIPPRQILSRFTAFFEERRQWLEKLEGHLAQQKEAILCAAS